MSYYKVTFTKNPVVSFITEVTPHGYIKRTYDFHTMIWIDTHPLEEFRKSQWCGDPDNWEVIELTEDNLFIELI